MTGDESRKGLTTVATEEHRGKPKVFPVFLCVRAVKTLKDYPNAETMRLYSPAALASFAPVNSLTRVLAP
jgi:hypothetical protein